MFTTDKKIYSSGSLLELAKKKVLEKQAKETSAQTAIKNPYLKTSTSYQNLKPQEPIVKEKPQAETTLRTLFPQDEKPLTTLATKLAKGGEVVGNILGRIAGAAIGSQLGYITSRKQGLGKIQDSIKAAKDLSKEEGRFGSQIVSQGVSMFPKAIQTTIDIGKMTPQVIKGNEEQFINYVAQKFIEQVPETTLEQARNYLLTGNYEGNIKNIDKNEVAKAWYASLLPIGMDMWMASSLATSAYNSYYKNNPTAGYRPTESIKMDFDKGVATLIKDKSVSSELFKPKEGVTGQLEVTKGEPTLGRKLASPIIQINKSIIKSQYLTPEQARLQASEVPEAPTTQPTLTTPQTSLSVRSQLPIGTSAIPEITPIVSSQVGFQMLDSKAIKTAQILKTKLEKAIQEKQVLIKKGASQTTIDEIKKLQTIINKIDNKLQVAEQKKVIGVGPVTQREQISTVQPSIVKEPTKVISNPITPSTPTVTLVKPTIKQISPKVEQAIKVPTLYHGTDEGKLKIDKNGNINLGTSKSEIERFGPSVEIDSSKMKIKSFPTKEELFNAVKNKGYYSRKGYDILMSENHALAINPIKFASQVDLPVRDIRKMTIGGELSKLKEITKEKKSIGRPKEEGTVSVDEAKAIQSKILQKSREGKTYKDYLAEAEKKGTIKKTEAPEQIRERLKIERERFAKVQEKQLQEKYGNFEKVPSKEEIQKRAYLQQLEKYKKEGKNEDFFRKLYQEEFDSGNDLRADVIFDFMQDLPGFTKISQLIDMMTLKPLERALNKGIETGLKFLWKKVYGPQLLDSLQHTLKKSEFVNYLGHKIIYRYNQPQWYKDLSDATEKGIIKSSNISEEMAKYLGEGLTTEEKITLQQAIINGGQHPNSKIGDRALVARRILDDYGEQFYRVGAISREVFEKNKGQYLMRAYYNHELQKPLTDFITSTGGEKASLSRAKKRGIEKIVSENKAQELIKEGWEDRGMIKTRPGYQRIWRDFTKEERSVMGEILEAPEYLVAKTIKQVGYDVAILNKFSEVAKHLDMVKDTSFSNFKRLPDSKQYGKLAGKYVDPFIYEDVKGIITAKDAAHNFSNQMLSEWKKFKVVDNPATHFRNMYFNFLLSDIAGLSPHRVDIYGSSLVDIIYKKADFIEARNEGLFGSTWTGNELGNMLDGVNKKKLDYSKIKINDKTGMYKVDFKSRLGDSVFNIMSKLKDVYGKVQGNLGALYEAEEQWNKLSLFKYAKYDLGMEIKDAVSFAKKWGLNYQAVTPFFANLSQKWYGIPFIRFQLLAAPRILEASITRMATIAKWILIMTFLEEQARKKLGLTEERLKGIKQNLFPKWMQSGLYILYPELDKYGQYQFMDLSYIVPFVQDVKAFNPMNFVFQNPGVQYAAAIISNKDPFLGVDIQDKDVEPGLSGWLKAYSQYFYKQIVPPIVPGGYNWTKISKAIHDSTDLTIEEKGVQIQSISSSIADSVFGLKLRAFNPTKQQELRLKEVKAEYQALIQEVKKLGKGWEPYTRYTEKQKLNRLEFLANRIKETMIEGGKITGVDISTLQEE